MNYYSQGKRILCHYRYRFQIVANRGTYSEITREVETIIQVYYASWPRPKASLNYDLHLGTHFGYFYLCTCRMLARSNSCCDISCAEEQL